MCQIFVLTFTCSKATIHKVCATAIKAVDMAKKINLLREQDVKKIHSLGKTASKTAMEVLYHMEAAGVEPASASAIF